MTMIGPSWRRTAELAWQLRPKFDRRARYVWTLALTALLAQQILFAQLGFSLAGSEPWISILIGMPMILVAGMLRRAGKESLPAIIETVVLLRVAAFSFFLLQFPVLSLSGALADLALLKVDRFLGFDWTSFSRLFADWKWHLVLGAAYATFRVQGVVVLIFLCSIGLINRAWQLLTAAMSALMVVIVLLSVFAADGSYVGCGLRPEGMPYHAEACRYGDIIHSVKSGALRTIDETMYLGLGSFPSFHVAGALMYVWAVWHRPSVRWIMLILNLLLGIGSIVIGGHYLVDIVGGLLLGATAIIFAKRLLPDSVRIENASARS